ncbi:MAG TPA: FtsX-like permease family protein [Bryobacteraceae bacterium]|nr:FtsX-like permease family protein [Bryobacteraceae bacterium]
MTNKLVVENLKFRPVRSVLSIVAIGLEVTMMLTIVGLSQGMLADSQERARGVGADIIVRPPGTSVLSLSSAPLPEKMIPFLERKPHVTLAVGSMNHPVGGITTVTGINLDAFQLLSGGFRFLQGGPPKGRDDIIVDRYYANQNNLKAGSSITLMNRKWRVSGIFEQGKLARLVVPLAVLQDLTGNTGKLSQIFVKVDRPSSVGPVIADLKASLPGYQIYSIEEFVSMISVQNVGGLSAFIGVIIGLSVIIGFLVVFLSMYTAVLERTREIGILKALGATPAFVLSILLRETFLLAVFGSILGIAFSYVTRWLIMTLVPSSLSQHIVPLWWPIAGGIALAGAMLGSAYPGWRAARQDPIEALSYE